MPIGSGYVLLRVDREQVFPSTEGHSQYTLGIDVAFLGDEREGKQEGVALPC
jgi:hypothetical protein